MSEKQKAHEWLHENIVEVVASLKMILKSQKTRKEKPVEPKKK